MIFLIVVTVVVFRYKEAICPQVVQFLVRITSTVSAHAAASSATAKVIVPPTEVYPVKATTTPVCT